MHQAIYFGLLINSALYIAGCFVAGIVFGVSLAWKLAIVTAAIIYVSYFVQTVGSFDGYQASTKNALKGIAVLLTLASIVSGAVAGMALLIAGV